MNDVESRVRDFILRNFLFTSDVTRLATTDSLLGRGIMDSTGALELITFLEREFGIVVAEEEMVPENLDSVDVITSYVDRKRAAAAAAG